MAMIYFNNWFNALFCCMFEFPRSEEEDSFCLRNKKSCKCIFSLWLYLYMIYSITFYLLSGNLQNKLFSIASYMNMKFYILKIHVSSTRKKICWNFNLCFFFMSVSFQKNHPFLTIFVSY